MQRYEIVYTFANFLWFFVYTCYLVFSLYSDDHKKMQPDRYPTAVNPLISTYESTLTGLDFQTGTKKSRLGVLAKCWQSSDPCRLCSAERHLRAVHGSSPQALPVILSSTLQRYEICANHKLLTHKNMKKLSNVNWPYLLPGDKKAQLLHTPG